VPIYAYRCANCGFEQDVLQKMSDAKLTVCPNCGQPELQKQVTAAGFQLKGSGWYVTDFRNNAQAKPKDNASAASKDGQPSGDAKPAEGAAAPTATDASKQAAGPPAASDTKVAAAPAPAPAASSESKGSSGSGGTGKSGASCPISSKLSG
jgi:putative FmdB family regulatory protein